MGVRALHLALPSYSLVAVASVIVFPGSGLSAQYITSHALLSIGLRSSLLLCWVTLTMPLARWLVCNSQSFWLRSLPVPRSWLLLPPLVGQLFLQVAWWVVWWRGESLGCGLWSWLVVLGLQCQWLAGFRHSLDFARAFILAGVWFSSYSPWALAAGCWPALSSCERAWCRAPEGRAQGRHWVVGKSAQVALAQALLIAAVRANGSALFRVGIVVALAFAGTLVGLGNNPHWTSLVRLQWLGCLWNLVWSLAAVALAAPLLQAEKEMSWLLDAHGVTRAARVASHLKLVAGLGILGGAAYAVALSRALGLPIAVVGGVSAWLLLALSGGLLGLWFTAVVRWSTRGTGRDSSRLTGAMLVTAGVVVASWLSL